MSTAKTETYQTVIDPAGRPMIVLPFHTPIPVATINIISQRCTLGVGCDEYGVCYAAAHSQPARCPKG